MTRVRCVDGNRRVAITDGWQVAAAPAGATLDQRARWHWIPARVPGTAASALQAAQAWSWDESRQLDAEDFWWCTRIRGESGLALLGFEGIATLADVWLDGEHILTSANMFIAHQVAVELRGEHELLIRCRALAPELAIRRSRPRWRVPMLEHQQLRWFRTSLLGRTPGWSPPCPPIGPWRPVWIEYRSIEVGDIDLHSRLHRSDVGDFGVVEIGAVLDARIDHATLVVERDTERIAMPLSQREGRWSGSATITSPALWWPHTHGEPALYRMSLDLRHAGGSACIDLGTTGFRSIEIDRGAGDDFRVRVNGVAVFCRGACWTPLDVVSLGASAQAYRDAIAQVRDAGMNMLRVGGTMVYEDDAFYDALDEQGILLWQDLMFANMDYPDEAEFTASVLSEVDQQLARLQARPCVAIICGNSEGEQQAAMSGAARERWSPPLFHELLAGRVSAAGFAYTPSSTHGGAFPHAANAGPASYYGVGAYLRPLEDARRADVRFASECLAFANIPFDAGLPRGAASRVQQALWKARAPRDLGAGWDFDDVRDHYVQRLYGIDPTALRVSDHERYLELGRAATGEVMAQVFAEWRRARSPTRGGLVWWLRDLWPGAGWGVIDARGVPKPCFYPLRRALAPTAVAISDEGGNGLAIHVVNDHADALAARVEIVLYRDGEIVVGRGAREVVVAGHAAIELAATDLFECFIDLSFAYRFGPPVANVVHVMLVAGDRTLAETHWFPSGLSSMRERDVGLQAVAARGTEPGEHEVTISCARFAQSVVVDAPGFIADDGYFHLVPGCAHVVRLRRDSRSAAAARGMVSALNAEAVARFDIAS